MFVVSVVELLPCLSCVKRGGSDFPATLLPFRDVRVTQGLCLLTLGRIVSLLSRLMEIEIIAYHGVFIVVLFSSRRGRSLVGCDRKKNMLFQCMPVCVGYK